jgi:hypothetical protein
MCINRLRADQLGISRLASALLPALLGGGKIVAKNKKAISNAIKQYGNNKWSLGFEPQETDD